MKRSNLLDLIKDARKHPEGAQASAGKWRAFKKADGAVDIWHYTTRLIEVGPRGKVRTISEGWGSVSDKRGIKTILEGMKT
jgi:hypothetical protein